MKDSASPSPRHRGVAAAFEYGLIVALIAVTGGPALKGFATKLAAALPIFGALLH